MQEYPDFNDSGKNPPKVGHFVLGAMLGAGIALLLAPAHGRDARRVVGHKVKQLGSTAKSAFNRTRNGLNHVKDDAVSAIDKGRQEYRSTMRTSTPAV
ncbi:MAG TPA: YtxH domain-containing protein [Candidatus Polarisedimenticolia bacterium]|nr:YtxH domain-containing protein [Candidatus Polarisedimenticolia bacterium]